MSADPNPDASSQPTTDDVNDEASSKSNNNTDQPNTQTEQKSANDVECKLNKNTQCGQRTCTVYAHNKMICHALKHLSGSVFGLLIGTTYKDPRSSNTTYCHVMDVIPLQHTVFSAMVIEVAFLQIEEWLSALCKAHNISGKHARVLGVYFANNHGEDVNKNTSAIIIASQLVARYSRASVLMCQIVSDRIDMAYKGEDCALDWYMMSPKSGDAENKKSWRDIDDVFVVQSGDNAPSGKNIVTQTQYEDWFLDAAQLQSLDVAKQRFNELRLQAFLEQKPEQQLYDFDDHLDDPSKDW
eukprot:CAMPEP_0202703838 /NCGR_PEP_ID=MMETSP1385-20130828/16637_1 /ASSEMBLY_ACC=CAM_ASM_000861 /TAXON_ID=933848 /ORGANISM="Elphidium margaritaceum" /LENGTH=297 /DNA_ID=CAMNT_0049361753 /DNA_START=40 /DNA_END=930 /DNA_ORIENTATION=-